MRMRMILGAAVGFSSCAMMTVPGEGRPVGDGESERVLEGSALETKTPWRDRLLKRLQFTIDGLESTRGADVVVDFSEHWQAADGSVWPGRFVEPVVRPVPVKAHDWRMTGLRLDGRKMR